jgi:mono/diheme cytochrome c family protein
MGGIKKTVRLGAFGRLRASPASVTLRISSAIAAFAVAVSLAGDGAAQPGPPANPQFVWLEQGWRPEVRAAYHHQSQGTATLPIPYSWFLALQQPSLSPSAGLFRDPAYLEKFGFIPSPPGPGNRDGLPIGFARTTGINPLTGEANDPRTGLPNEWIGFTCAACHTARIDSGTTRILVDGGPALIDLGGFGKQLATAMLATDVSLTRFPRFARAVLGDRDSPAERARLHSALHKTVVEGFVEEFLHDPGGTTEGFGRLDALNRIGNTVFGAGMGIRRNFVPTTAPVAYPHIWDTSWFAWVQYNGSIERPMVRNAGEAMGVGGMVNYQEGPTPRFSSTIPVLDLYGKIEQMLAGDTPPLPAQRFSGLRSPAWPAAILGPINADLAARGADLYKEICQGCHLPAPNTPEFWTSDRWTPVNEAGERYLDLHLVPISRVGTDPSQARDMAGRTVLVSPDLGLKRETGTVGNLRRYGYGDALGQLVALTVDRGYSAHLPPIPTTDYARLNGYRENGIQAKMVYKARPLDGIWATPPYLHNGSVPTLWALLSPRSMRPATFRLGSHAYDARNVGYIDGGGFKLDTSKPGNSNSGHQFDGPAGVPPASRPPGVVGRALSEDERWALIEYLKTL